MSLKDHFTLATSINALVQHYTFFYVWLTCIDTSVFGL